MNRIFPKLSTYIASLNINEILPDREKVLRSLIEYIRLKYIDNQCVRLSFICTHNSRRSHLSQIWAQVMAAYSGIPNVYCYSGGTEATALFPTVVETLRNTGFEIGEISEGQNPIYAVKFGENAQPIIGFSKKFDATFNPASGFMAVMTCSHADENCPIILGAEKRISVTYEDPKISDSTPQQREVYAQRSRQIATEMLYVFSKIKY